MITLILASGNSHKAQEFSKLLDSDVFFIEAAEDKIEVEENGNTYSENALQKAKAYYQKYKKPVLSDDSGITVGALPDDLGIKSARFGGEGLSDRDRVSLLLKKMEGLNERSAYFTCVLCFYLNPDEIFFFEGRVEGKIGHEIKGEHGFGYDPVFHPDGEHENSTIAQIPEWKAKNSHRARASILAGQFFKEKLK